MGRRLPELPSNTSPKHPYTRKKMETQNLASPLNIFLLQSMQKYHSNKSPVEIASPAEAYTSLTTPSFGACTVVSIFIDSVMSK